MVPARFPPNAKIDWYQIFPDYDSIPQNMKVVLNFVIPSLVYKANEIAVTLNKNHPLFSSRFWRNGCQITLKDQILPPTKMFCPVTKMSATGVPPMIQMQFQNEVNITEMKVQNEVNNKNIVQKLDEMQVEMRSNFINNVNTDKPVAVREMKAAFDAMVPSIVQQTINGLAQSNILGSTTTTTTTTTSSSSSVLAVPIIASTSTPIMRSNQLIPYTDVLFQEIPEDFRFPTKITVLCLCDFWYNGDILQSILPFKLMNAQLLHTTPCKKAFSQAKTIMTLIKCKLPSNFEVLGSSGKDSSLSQAYNQVVNDLKQLDKTPRNYETMSYSAFITYVTKAGMLKK